MPEVYRPKKHFSLKEANGTLPLVSRIVGDIVRTTREIRRGEAEAAELGGSRASPRVDALQARLDGLVEDLQEYVGELEGVGCELKDFERGLVDFPARLGNRTVLLCWKLGEPQVLHWHELDAGFAGRQPITSDFAG